MTKEQWLGIIRHILTVLAGMAVTWGWFDEAMTGEIVGAILTIIAVVWSAKSPEKKAAKEARDAR